MYHPFPASLCCLLFTALRRHLQGHFPAFLSTFPAGFRTLLAVLVIMSGTLLGAPFTDLGAEFTVPGSVLTFPCQGPGAEVTDVQAFPTTVRAVVMTIHADHLFQTIFTVDHTFQAGINTFLIFHSSNFFLKNQEIGTQVRIVKKVRQLIDDILISGEHGPNKGVSILCYC